MTTLNRSAERVNLHVAADTRNERIYEEHREGATVASRRPIVPVETVYGRAAGHSALRDVGLQPTDPARVLKPPERLLLNLTDALFR